MRGPIPEPRVGVLTPAADISPISGSQWANHYLPWSKIPRIFDWPAFCPSLGRGTGNHHRPLAGLLCTPVGGVAGSSCFGARARRVDVHRSELRAGSHRAFASELIAEFVRPTTHDPRPATPRTGSALNACATASGFSRALCVKADSRSDARSGAADAVVTVTVGRNRRSTTQPIPSATSAASPSDAALASFSYCSHGTPAASGTTGDAPASGAATTEISSFRVRSNPTAC